MDKNREEKKQFKSDEIKEAVRKYGSALVEYRRHFHRRPELSFQEKETSALICKKLSEMGIPLMKGVRANSCVGVIEGEEPGPVLLFRADMDALPVTEETGLPYASERPGIMHACGHDAHTAVLLCFADFLSHHRDLVKGTVKLVFQQGEEKEPNGGSWIVEDGVLDDVDAVLAWHCSPELELGIVSASEGPRTASTGSFEIRIQGVGGHSGFPYRSVDPVSTGAMIVNAVNQLIGWTVDPMSAAALSVTYFEAGKKGAYNIIPDSAAIGGNLRSLTNETADKLFCRIRELAENICRAKGCTCEFMREDGPPAMENNRELSLRVKNALLENGINAMNTPPIMASEDFAFYTRKKPGVYFNVGTHNPLKPETACMPHNPRFCIDEEAMSIALEVFIVSYLELTKNPIAGERRGLEK